MYFVAAALLLPEFVGTFFIALTHALTTATEESGIVSPLAVGAMQAVCAHLSQCITFDHTDPPTAPSQGVLSAG
eukprot:997110-Pyramimonas_sp.AAC.1